jgi:IS5 family transposase
MKRNLNYVNTILPHKQELVLGKDYPLSQKVMLVTIHNLYLKQKAMYDTKTHTYKDRIVSISQPQVRPIVRGKQNAQVVFGSKLGVGLDNGFALIETF